MKIVNVIGGLGNQMFQFAFYLALRKRFPEETVKIYTGTYKGYSKHNAYELDRVFGLAADEAATAEVRRMAWPYTNYRVWQIGHHLLPQRKTMLNEKIFGHYYPEAFQRQGDCYYDGYWQNEKYFHDLRMDLLMAYTPIDIDEHNMAVARQLASTNSVSIHVRHGDFMKKKIYKGICTLDYYRQAIREIQTRTAPQLFCIFSNDIPWCKDNILPLLQAPSTPSSCTPAPPSVIPSSCTSAAFSPQPSRPASPSSTPSVIIADWNTGRNSHLDMYLMSQCRHNIIAHSSFSWWGAWLNQHPDKIVIGPKKWVNIKNSEFQLNPEWIALEA